MSKDNNGYIQGWNREQQQLLPSSIEEYVAEDSPVRFVDAFVQELDIAELELSHQQPCAVGRPAYDPRLMLGLFIYGYLNRVESCRRLEREAGCNLEVMWLLRNLRPDFKTIARFRSENSEVFRGVLQEFNRACQGLGLFSREVAAIDGAKFKAVNSSDRYLKREQLLRNEEKADAKIASYLEALQRAAAQEESELERELEVGKKVGKDELERKIAHWRAQKAKSLAGAARLDEAGVDEMALTDGESVRLTDRKHRGGVVGYNVQASVEAKSHLIVEIDAVTDKNDLGQLAAMAVKTQQALEIDPDSQEERLTVLADAGYHQADELEACEKKQIETIVPAPQTTSGRNKKGEEIFPLEVFVYDREEDLYECPGGARLERHSAGQSGKSFYYNRAACSDCELKPSCTSGELRRIARRDNQEVVERAAVRHANNRELFAQRKCVVEHVFGTLRNNGQDEFLQKGLKKVRGELQLSALAYNIKRAIKLVGIAGLIEAVKKRGDDANRRQNDANRRQNPILNCFLVSIGQISRLFSAHYQDCRHLAF